MIFKKQTSVLVVDDDESVLVALQVIFEEEGFRVLIAANAAQALRLIADEFDIGLLVTDFNLFEALDGVDIALAMRSKSPEIPVILATGSMLENSRIEELLSLNHVLALRKPFTRNEVLNAIRQLLDRPFEGE